MVLGPISLAFLYYKFLSSILLIFCALFFRGGFEPPNKIKKDKEGVGGKLERSREKIARMPQPVS